MKIGDIVVCRDPRGYAFTEGKEYTVLAYEPKFFDKDTPSGFTWPAYVEVMDDYGRRVHCHANRFIQLGD